MLFFVANSYRIYPFQVPLKRLGAALLQNAHVYMRLYFLNL